MDIPFRVEHAGSLILSMLMSCVCVNQQLLREGATLKRTEQFTALGIVIHL